MTLLLAAMSAALQKSDLIWLHRAALAPEWPVSFRISHREHVCVLWLC